MTKEIIEKIMRDYVGIQNHLDKIDFPIVASAIERELSNSDRVVVVEKIAEKIYRKVATKALIKMKAPEFVAEEILNEIKDAKLDEEDKEIMSNLAKVISNFTT